MPKNTNKGTSPKVASDAAGQLSNPESTAKERKVAASDLAQAARKGKKKGKKK